MKISNEQVSNDECNTFAWLSGQTTCFIHEFYFYLTNMVIKMETFLLITLKSFVLLDYFQVKWD